MKPDDGADSSLSRLPACWASLNASERTEVLELLDLLETKPPGPVELRASERIRNILEAATAKDRRLWHFRDPSMPTILSAI